MQAKQPKITHTGRAFLIATPPSRKQCALCHTRVSDPCPSEKLEPDPVQYVPAWHRLQETEELAPATLPSDAECPRLKSVD